ncbi:TPA: hypothetical protein DCE37_19600 [Candidatus Latescibacteria bacterium]|mgnify:CR=1 FL=1|nr:hypothetical protein [Candidatus Latescibacterota bacterium]|tara:strand:+ start:506 stop:754 length:249 start_codon:yes stop_codon:yes gene_type:complete
MAKTFYLEDLANLGINPYEAVIASSREARRLNQNRLMADAGEGPEKMTTTALSRVVDEKVEVGYGDSGSQNETDAEESSAGS